MLPQLHQTNTTSCGMQLRQHCFGLVRPRQYSTAVEMCVCVCVGGGGGGGGGGRGRRLVKGGGLGAAFQAMLLPTKLRGT